MASKPRSGSARAATSAAARGRRVQGRTRLYPTSKNSAVTRPYPEVIACARSSCHPRDVSGS